MLRCTPRRALHAAAAVRPTATAKSLLAVTGQRAAVNALYNNAAHRTTSLRPSTTPQPAREYFQWSTSVSHVKSWTSHNQLAQWILDCVRKFQPARVHLCDGSDEENEDLLLKMVHSGGLIKLNSQLRPGSYLARSTASDVARVEEKTFICSETEKDAGFTNNWRDPEEMHRHMSGLFESCMRGRTMYVVPFVMGPLDSPFSQLGVQVTDSPYAVASMRIMTRMGAPALAMLGDDKPFVPCVHSVGVPLVRGQEDSTWPQNSKEKWIVHFPEERRIWSFGSGYGGNALLGKKCYALRIASVIAQEEGWLAEHMLIVGVTNPQGQKKYLAAAFPSACGKTNLAMMKAKLPGWKVECVGDDIAWLRIGKDGRLWATNPEAGFFGVAPGTSADTNPYAVETIQKNTIFTNVALKPDGDVWWEGLTKDVPPSLTSWLRTERYPDSGYDAAHPNSRFTVAATQCPVMDPNWQSPEGVPISAIIFGGRRSTTVPLVYQARDWEHGVFVGASMTSETTAAAAGKRGVLRNDPFAMRPFMGYNMADYFGHWLTFSKRTDPALLPKIFHVNWFRKSAGGKFLWPGFGENIRVIDWILKQCDADTPNSDIAYESPIGFLPKPDAVNIDGLGLNTETLEELNRVDAREWLLDLNKNKEFLQNFGDRLPQEIQQQVQHLQSKLEAADPLSAKQ